jgi:hypothetical protein
MTAAGEFLGSRVYVGDRIYLARWCGLCPWFDAVHSLSSSSIALYSTYTGKAFTGVSPMDFYLRQNAQKKAEKAKEQETKVGVYKHNMYKGSLWILWMGHAF